MNIGILEIVGYIYTVCVNIVAVSILITGTFIILNQIVWNHLIRMFFKWTLLYKRLYYYLYYYNEIKKVIGDKANNLFKKEEEPPI